MTKLEEVALLKEQMRNLLSQAKTEKRSLTDEEQTKFNELMTRKNQIVIDETLRSLESSKSAILPENKRAIFAKALYDVCNHRSLEEYGNFADAKGLNFSMRAEGDPVRTSSTDAAPMIPTTIGDIIEPLEKGLIVNKLGIKMQYGLIGELMFPTLAAVEATIEGENTKINPTKLDIGNLKAHPRRVYRDPAGQGRSAAHLQDGKRKSGKGRRRHERRRRGQGQGCGNRQSEPHQPFQKRVAVAARLRASAHTGMGQKCA